jgi:hypothetical protein
VSAGGIGAGAVDVAAVVGCGAVLDVCAMAATVRTIIVTPPANI